MASTRSSWHPRIPTRLESLLFIALMSGPPKFRDRDVNASLSGSVDLMVLIQICVWACAGAWVFYQLFPSLLRRGTVPLANGAQVLGALLIATLSFSLLRSPGVLLTGFMLGQFVVMLAFAWVFVDRFGSAVYLRHVFAGLVVLCALMSTALFLDPELVLVGSAQRFRGDRIAPTGPVAAMALVFCLSNVPRMRSVVFWPALAFFGTILAISRTRTAYVAFLIYMVVGFLFGKGLRIRKLVPLLVVVATGLIVLDVYQSTTTYLVRDTESIQTMSDRIPLWTFLTKAVLREEPLMGLGYYAASRVLAPQYNYNLGNAHSAFFEVLVGGGLAGIAAYLVLCVALIWYAVNVLRAGRRSEAVAAVGLLGIAVVQAITSSEAINAGPVGFTFWSLTAILPAILREPIVERGHLVQVRRRVSLVRPVSAGHAPLS